LRLNKKTRKICAYPIFSFLVSREWITSWKQGLPDPEDTPGEINIPVILFLRNLALAFDMIEYGKMRFNLFGGGGHWFPGAKVESSSQLAAEALQGALSHSPHADKIPGYLQQAYEMLKSEDLKRLSQSD
jgi:predicted aldo/keto reductase-like oxidoreductase